LDIPYIDAMLSFRKEKKTCLFSILSPNIFTVKNTLLHSDLERCLIFPHTGFWRYNSRTWRDNG